MYWNPITRPSLLTLLGPSMISILCTSLLSLLMAWNCLMLWGWLGLCLLIWPSSMLPLSSALFRVCIPILLSTGISNQKMSWFKQMDILKLSIWALAKASRIQSPIKHSLSSALPITWPHKFYQEKATATLLIYGHWASSYSSFWLATSHSVSTAMIPTKSMSRF